MKTPIKVMPVGIGKMGKELVKAIKSDPNMVIEAVVDTASLKPGFGGSPMNVEGDTYRGFNNVEEALEKVRPDVAVFFTTPGAGAQDVLMALNAGAHAVVGTTGVDESYWNEIKRAAKTSENLLVAPNFAIGAVLMMQFAEKAARYMPDAEIIELHHGKKKDAPSGTALMTADRIDVMRSAASEHRCFGTIVGAGTGDTGRFRSDDFPSRGLLVKDTPIHSVRLPGLVAHQEVVFGGQGQTLSVRHDSIDRSSFMPGVLMAIRAVCDGSARGFTYGIDDLFD